MYSVFMRVLAHSLVRVENLQIKPVRKLPRVSEGHVVGSLQNSV